MSAKTTLLNIFCIFLFVFAARIVPAQSAEVNTPKQDPDAESIPTLLVKQQSEIDQLREELRKEVEIRKQQTALLESLNQKLQGLVSALTNAAGPGTPTNAIIPTVQTGASVAGPTAVRSAAQPPDKKQDAPQAVESGFGKIKFSGLFQAGYLAADQGTNDTFRIRRAEIKFAGTILPEVKWTVMFDLAKGFSLRTIAANIDGTPVIASAIANQSSRIFQEGFVTFSHFKRANINVGQFKIPLSQEGLQSSSALDTIERALFMSDRLRGGGMGDTRDLGIMAFGPLNKQLDYQFGVFNGVGEVQNDLDQNEQKAFVGRMVFKPSAIKGLQIGGSGAFGSGPRSDANRRDRLGGELVYDWGKLRIKGEFMTGVDGDVHRQGHYAHFGYRFHRKFEGIFRYDVFDPDVRKETTAASETERDYIAGLNYYIRNNNFKLQFNYIRKTFAAYISPSRNVFLVNLQTSW